MKKVLIIANLFYASPRIPGLAKYLPEFGWQPIILTVPLGEDPDSRLGPPNDFKAKNRVVETYDYVSPRLVSDDRLKVKKSRVSNFKRWFRRSVPLLYKWYWEVKSYPDTEKKWKSFAIKAGDQLLRNEDVDALISSSSPVTCHIIAKELKERHKIPWVADFRDLWTQNHNYSYSSLRKLFEQRLELKTLATADALITVSGFWSKKLSMLHGRKVLTINNGFDPDQISNEKVDLTSAFTITYTGQIYRKQDPSKLLLGLKNLISQEVIDPKEVEVRFYGPLNERLEKEVKQYGMSDIVVQYGVISRKTSFERQGESQLLLLLNWEDPEEKGVHTGKIFEYLAAQRPILATGGFGNDAVETVLQETNSGIYCSTVEDIKSALRDLYREYKLKGKVTYSGNMEEINKYNYQEMARKFARILDTITKRGD